MNYQTSSSSSPSTLPNSTPARTKTKTTTTTTFTLKNTTTTYPPFLRPAVPTNPRNPTTTTSPTPTTTSPTPTTTTTSSTSILPSQQTRYAHTSTPKRKPTVFDDGAYFLYWQDKCMRAMWDCFNTRRSEVPYGRGWEKTYERSGEDGEREMVEWGGWERMAGVLEYNYHIFGNFSIMFGGRDAAGNVKIYFYHQRTAHPTLPEIRILAYLWIRRTFTPIPTPPTTTPNPSLTGPATPPASNTAPPHASISRKRKRRGDEEISDDVTRLQGTSGGAEMGTGGLGRGGKLEGVAVVVMGEWLCMNR